MNSVTLGEKIASLRKNKDMTQAELARLMGVTDKAVSKWERNLSCPDINSIPKLADIFDISVNDLLNNETVNTIASGKNQNNLLPLIFKSIGLAMGVAVVIITTLSELNGESVDVNSVLSMLGIGLCCISLYIFNKS